MLRCVDELSPEALAAITDRHGMLSWENDWYYQPTTLDTFPIPDLEHAGVWVSAFRSCNNQCRFCNHHSGAAVPVDIEQLVENLAVVAARGVRRVALAGGEITLLPELPEVVSRLRQAGYDAISLATNARRLSDGDYCQRLIDAGVGSFLCSLHGYDERTGDLIASRPGAFAEALAGLEQIGKRRPPGGTFLVNHVVTSVTVGHLDTAVRLILGAGADVVQLSMVEMHVAGDEVQALIPRLGEVREALARALPLVTAAGKEALMEAIPPCVYPGYEPFYLDGRRQRQAGYLRIHYEGRRDHDLVLINQGSVKRLVLQQASVCSECLYQPVCAGTYYSYFQRHGAEGLAPVRQVPEPRT
jgi:MoaA/NifB/PqqE/SkfB family radical SAM enzyme